jgi:hypothetical protein
MPRLSVSKNQRLLIVAAFLVGYFAITFVLDFLHGPIYSLLAWFLYPIVGYVVLSALFGGPTAEQGYTYPFPIGAVFNNIPKVFEANRKRPHGRRKLYGKVMNADQTSNSYLLKLGWWPSASFMAVNLTKLDENRTVVQVRLKTGFFHVFDPSKAMFRLFFDLLYSSLTA